MGCRACPCASSRLKLFVFSVSKMRAFVRTSTRACGVALLLVLALLPLAQAFLPAATRGPSAVHRARQITMSATAGHVPPTAAPSAAAKRPRREIKVVNVSKVE